MVFEKMDSPCILSTCCTLCAINKIRQNLEISCMRLPIRTTIGHKIIEVSAFFTALTNDLSSGFLSQLGKVRGNEIFRQEVSRYRTRG